MEFLGALWTTVLIDPLINALVFLYTLLFQSMGLAIVALTVIIRGVTFPLTLRQIKATLAMQALQPQLQEVQRKYKGQPQMVQRETMRLYREHGVSPLGCLGPMVVQIPIWIGLYQAIIQGLGSTPSNLVYLSQHLYSWLPQLTQAIPIDTRFLWMDLTLPDPWPILPLLVGASTWAQQKMSMTNQANVSPQQRTQNQVLLWMMPAMMGFFSLTLAAGLPLYWLLSNVITMVVQYFIAGWGGLKPAPAQGLAAAPPPASNQGRDGRESGELGQDGGGSDRSGASGARGPTRRRRRRRSRPG
ncbi:MAG: membrane protein insertase YidC [Chloroflexi bacterium]|nr:membrane protein insertase YidC [Chloroflexota bacterium]